MSGTARLVQTAAGLRVRLDQAVQTDRRQRVGVRFAGIGRQPPTSTLRGAVCPSKPSEHTFGPGLPRGGSTRRQALRPVPSDFILPDPKQGGNR